MLAPLLKGIMLGILLAISVGPIMFSIIKQSLTNGHKGGFIFVAGVSLSDIILVIMSQLFAESFSNLLHYKKAIGLGGGILLVGLGLYLYFFKKDETIDLSNEADTLNRKDSIKIFVSGFLMNAFNPGGIAFWIAAGAITSSLNYTLTERIVMFTTCLLFVLSTDIAKVMLAGLLRNKLTLKTIHIINHISALILVGFGVALLWEGFQ